MFESNRITLEAPMRKNQVNFKPQAFIFRKSRKRIETLLSQLCDQFMIRRNYAKSFDGFKNRLLTKITRPLQGEFGYTKYIWSKIEHFLEFMFKKMTKTVSWQLNFQPKKSSKSKCLRFCNGLGTSKNVVMIQIWTALITILILKYLKAISKYP